MGPGAAYGAPSGLELQGPTEALGCPQMPCELARPPFLNHESQSCFVHRVGHDVPGVEGQAWLSISFIYKMVLATADAG